VASICTNAPFPRLGNQHKREISVKDTMCESSEETICMRAAEMKSVGGADSQHRWQQVNKWLSTLTYNQVNTWLRTSNTKRQQRLRNRTRAQDP